MLFYKIHELRCLTLKSPPVIDGNVYGRLTACELDDHINIAGSSVPCYQLWSDATQIAVADKRVCSRYAQVFRRKVERPVHTLPRLLSSSADKLCILSRSFGSFEINALAPLTDIMIPTIISAIFITLITAVKSSIPAITSSPPTNISAKSLVHCFAHIL